MIPKPKTAPPRDKQDWKTLPWCKDEYMRVDGLELVYARDPESGLMLVRLYGGGAETVDELRRQGRFVELPRRMRTDG
jgi:hypothetical protein